ncbi:MAG: CpaF family protein [Bacillota bacterium]
MGGHSVIPRLIDVAEAQATIEEMTPQKWREIKRKCQDRVMASVPMDLLGQYRNTEARAKVSAQIRQVVENELPGIPYQAKQTITERITNEIFGYGPFEELLNDSDITEIIVERFDKIQVEKNGQLQNAELSFDAEEELRLVIERIITPLGRRLDWSSPQVDARLPDGSRVCAVIPPIAVDGAQIAIRKFRPNVSMRQLVDWGMLSQDICNALAACVKARLSIIISGGTGSGKTTFLNGLSEYIDPNLSLITIENPVELQLRHPHVRRWEARPANMEGSGEVNMMSLLITALRSRPDIIIVGEVRGKEAYVLMQALNTGHMGSMTTMHANNTEESVKRLVAMVTSAGELAPAIVPSYIAGGVDMVVQIMRFPDGKRRLTEIAEVTGEIDGKILTNPLVVFKGTYDGSQVTGHWETTGNKFTRLNTLSERGVPFSGWTERTG